MSLHKLNGSSTKNHSGAVLTQDVDLYLVLSHILKELQIMNTHLQIVTGDKIVAEDLEDKYL